MKRWACLVLLTLGLSTAGPRAQTAKTTLYRVAPESLLRAAHDT